MKEWIELVTSGNPPPSGTDGQASNEDLVMYTSDLLGDHGRPAPQRIVNIWDNQAANVMRPPPVSQEAAPSQSPQLQENPRDEDRSRMRRRGMSPNQDHRLDRDEANDILLLIGMMENGMTQDAELRRQEMEMNRQLRRQELDLLRDQQDLMRATLAAVQRRTVQDQRSHCTHERGKCPCVDGYREESTLFESDRD